MFYYVAYDLDGIKLFETDEDIDADLVEVLNNIIKELKQGVKKS